MSQCGNISWIPHWSLLGLSLLYRVGEKKFDNKQVQTFKQID